MERGLLTVASMFEPACEPIVTCNYDQTSFKGYLARWLTKSAIVYPPIVDAIRKRIQASSIAAAGQLNRSSLYELC